VYLIMRLRRSSAGDSGRVVMDCWVFIAWALVEPSWLLLPQS
jgi:hypothetical protein